MRNFIQRLNSRWRNNDRFKVPIVNKTKSKRSLKLDASILFFCGWPKSSSSRRQSAANERQRASSHRLPRHVTRSKMKWRVFHTLIGKCAITQEFKCKMFLRETFHCWKIFFAQVAKLFLESAARKPCYYLTQLLRSRADSNRFVLLALGCRWTVIGSRDNFFIHFMKETTHRKCYELKCKLEHFNTASEERK